MTTVSLAHRGSRLAAINTISPVGEALLFDVTMLTTDGLARSCLGGRLVLGIECANGATLRYHVAGTQSGEHTIEVPEDDAVRMRGDYSWDISYEPAAPGRTEVLLPKSLLSMARTASIDVDVGTTEAAPVVLPAIQQTIEVAAYLDLPGGTGEISAAEAVRAPYGVPTQVRVTVAQLQGLGADPQATGTLNLSRVGVALGTTVALTQELPGVFVGEISLANQLAAGAVFACQWSAFVIVGGINYVAVLPSDLTYFPTGSPLTSDPEEVVRVYHGVGATGLQLASTTAIEAALTAVDVTAGLSYVATLADQKLYLAVPASLDARWLADGWASIDELSPVQVQLHDSSGALAQYVLRESLYNLNGTALSLAVEY